MKRIWSFLAVLGAIALMGAAPDTFSRAQLQKLEAEKLAAERQLAALEAAETNAQLDVAALNASLLTAAAESRRREEQATVAERALIDLDIRRRNASDNLFADEAALEDLLAALASASRSRPPAFIVSPDRANASVRSAILMGDAAPELAIRAKALGVEINELNTLERSIRREQARLDAAEATLAVKRLEISRLAAAKRAKYEDVTADAAVLRARAEALAAKANDLRELLAALESEAPALPGRKPAAPQTVSVAAGRTGSAVNTGQEGKSGSGESLAQAAANLRPLGAREIGNMVQPVAGAVSETFGARKTTGGRSEGITFVTRQDAQVVAPVDGVIEFADPFRSYGHMLILRTSDNYRVIMTGLGDTFGTRGQSVTAGEPVGRMSARRNPPPELYLELRKNDRSENPAGWLER